MIFEQIPDSYAKALLELTQGKEQETIDYLSQVVEVIRKDREIENFFYNPAISRNWKIDVIKKTFQELLPEVLLNFLCVLAKNDRMIFLEEVLDIYRQYYDQMMNIIPVKVITAIPLDESLKKNIIETLSHYYKKNVDVEFITKPEIIGGIIIQSQGYEIDDSINTKLKVIYKNLKNTKLTGVVYED
ncbi:MAG: ATP synthase F1 subunit delta [Leptospiraceae bacterium]|nr:ATP synthase F1 subunit delta [Leptospiraceae bacterium]MDW7977038.1 ATP synthase F1 subunit delta [Leptospiraceae bacterium]